MGQNRVILGRQAPLYANDELIEGIIVVNVPGATSQRFPIGDVLDPVRRFAADIPDPGVASFAFNFNPADKLHQKLLTYQENNTLVRWKWYTEGKVVGGVKTKAGVPKGTVVINPMTVGTNKKIGTIKWKSFTVDEPSVGDYLENDTDSVKMQVTSTDYSKASGIEMKTLSAANLTAISTDKSFTLTQPATRIEFVGQISGIPMQGGQVVTANAQVTISGDVEFKVGTPDIA